MLGILAPHIGSLAIAGFDVGSDAIRSDRLVRIEAAARTAAPALPVETVTDMEVWLRAVEASKKERVLVITGSLYFISTVYPVLARMGYEIGYSDASAT